MKVSFFPETKSGKWSLVFFLAIILLFLFFIIAISIFNQRGQETFFGNLYLAIPMVMIYISGVLGFITGIISMGKSKKKAIASIISTVLCLVVILYGLAEIVFPH